MDDPKSTNDIRMIAQDVAHQQAEVCAARRDNLSHQLSVLAETVKASAANISTLTMTVTALTATVAPMAGAIKENSGAIKENAGAIDKLKGRPAVWAAIGAALPTLLGVLLWWFSK